MALKARISRAWDVLSWHRCFKDLMNFLSELSAENRLAAAVLSVRLMGKPST